MKMCGSKRHECSEPELKLRIGVSSCAPRIASVDLSLPESTANWKMRRPIEAQMLREASGKEPLPFRNRPRGGISRRAF
jgi:hypothetical protein